MQLTQVGPLGREDSVEKEIVTRSRILAWEIPWAKNILGYGPWGHKRVEHDLATNQGQQHTRAARDCGNSLT